MDVRQIFTPVLPNSCPGFESRHETSLVFWSYHYEKASCEPKAHGRELQLNVEKHLIHWISSLYIQWNWIVASHLRLISLSELMDFSCLKSYLKVGGIFDFQRKKFKMQIAKMSLVTCSKRLIDVGRRRRKFYPSQF